MLTYIFLFFIPGSAGNFFSRCINLASSRCHCWIDKNYPKLDLSAVEKFQLCQYSHSSEFSNWRNFESSLSHYSTVYPHHELDPGQVGVFLEHPDYRIFLKNIAGPQDQLHTFYIDPRENFEWCVLNALHKNSVLDKAWLSAGKKMLEDPNITKINLSNIINSAESLLQEVCVVCNVAGITLDPVGEKLIKDLWHQWISTTVPKSELKNFKEKIGYYT